MKHVKDCGVQQNSIVERDWRNWRRMENEVEYVKGRDVQRTESSYHRASVVQECDMQTEMCISGILVSPFMNGALNQAQQYYNASIRGPIHHNMH